MYAVAVEGGTVFVDGSNRRMTFVGTQLRLATELLPRSREVEIEMLNEDTMRFRENGYVFAEFVCRPWQSTTLGGGATELVQTCDGLDAANRRTIDADGQVTRLEYVLHPSYPPVVLTRGGWASENG